MGVPHTLNYAFQGVAAAGTAEVITATATYAQSAFFVAKKEGAVNVGNVYLGTSTVDKTSYQMIVLEPGDTFNMPINGGLLDLNTVYVDAANNDDGVVCLYITP